MTSTPIRLAALPLAFLAAAHAQTTSPAPADEPVALSPFVVASQSDSGYSAQQTLSGTRTATNIADLPMSITVLTNEFLDDLGAVDVGQALLYDNITVPATDIFTSNISTSYIIRGFTAATMHNGFLSAGGSTPVSRIAVDRVEVIKGPSSLLYGEMDPGGLVNIVSKRPSSTAAASISAWTGTYQDHGGNLDVTGPIDHAGRFSYRVLGMVDDSEAIYLGTHSKRKELVGMLGGKLTDTTDLNVEFDYVRNKVDAPGGEIYLLAIANDPLGRGMIRQYLLPGEGGPAANFNYRGPGDYGDGSERYLNAELHQKLGKGWNARLAFSNVWDNTGSISRNNQALLGTNTATDTYKHGTTTLEGLQGDITNDWTFSSNLDLKFLAGFTATRGHSDFASATSPTLTPKFNPLVPSTWPTPWPYPAPPTSSFTATTASSRGRYQDGAIYTTNLLDLFQKRLHLLAGARGQRSTATAVNYLSKTNAGFSLNAMTYQTGALFDITKNLGIYYSWSQSFNPQNQLLRDPKPLDPNTGLPLPGSINNTRPAQPIQGEGHDFGFKFSALDSKLDFTAAYYDVRRSNEIQTRTIGDGSGNTVDIYDVQSGTEWSQGVEFNLVGKPFTGVDLIASYNQPFSGQLLSDTTVPAYAGKQLQNNPHQQLSFFSKYTFQPRSGWLNGLSVGAGGRYWGKSQAFLPTQPQLAEIAPYFVADAVAAYHFRVGRLRYQVQLNASNLLDRHVIYNAYSYSGGTTYRLQFNVRY